MSDLTENVAKNVANEKVQDLTEKMIKGKLKRGVYWVVVNADGDRSIQPCVWGSEFDDFEEVDDEDLSFITAGNINQRGHFSICWEQVLAPVPSYEEWQSLNELVDSMNDTGKAFAYMLSPFTDDYFNGLTTKDIAELAKKSIRLTTQHCEDNAEIDKLKDLLKECRDVAEFTKTIVNKHKWLDEVITKIDEVLK